MLVARVAFMCVIAEEDGKSVPVAGSLAGRVKGGGSVTLLIELSSLFVIAEEDAKSVPVAGSGRVRGGMSVTVDPV